MFGNPSIPRLCAAIAFGYCVAVIAACKPDSGASSACEDYARKLCQEAGKQSPTCESIKGVASLLPNRACRAALDDFKITRENLARARKTCDNLGERLCAEFGDATQACDTVKDQIANLPVTECTVTPAEYQDILAQLRREVKSKEPLSAEQTAALTRPGAPAFGPENARVTIALFSDFQCPYCADAAKVTQRLRRDYADRVRFVLRQLPLEFHEHAAIAAQAALAANAQGRFWEYHDRLFADQSRLARPALEATARELGLDMPAFTAALDRAQFAAEVDTDVKLSTELRVDGTPTMFMNGVRVSDPTNFEALAAQIDAELARAGS